MPPQPNQESHQENNCQPSLKRRMLSWILGRIGWLFVNGLALLGGVALFYDFAPKISVSAFPLLDASDAFSAPFVIANNGYLSIQHVSARCVLQKAEFEPHFSIEDVGVSTSRIDIAEKMLPGEQLTVKCRLRETIGRTPPLRNADIFIIIKFQPLLWYGTEQRQFRFNSAQNSDGSWQWLPQPTNKG